MIPSSQYFNPQEEFAAQANLNWFSYQELQQKASADYSGFWADLAKQYISWDKPFSRGLNDDNYPQCKWFEDGSLNIAYNCLDRHLIKAPDKIAIIFESDAGDTEAVSYKQLHTQVCRFTNGLKSLGVKAGDCVILYLPHSIEAIVAMQSCARIGAIHSVVFSGFSAQALAKRILDAKAKYLITADWQTRGGKILPLKNKVDEALEMLGGTHRLSHIIVNKRTANACGWSDGRDIWWHDLISQQADDCAVTIVDSEHPLFILYTSGSTGTPKGVQHSSAGYLLGAILSMMWVFDFKADDVFWCSADVGWITGHTYVCYGPLAVGATQIIFEGIPTYPSAARFWQIIAKHKVSTFYTAPTVIRSLIKVGVDLPQQYDLSSLRLLGSVGEPINSAAWKWYYETIGNSRCPIVDTWWQTETGSNMLAPIPGITALKPGSCTYPLPGIMADIIDENGNELGNNATGYLVIKKPFPSQIRTIWNNHERYLSAYFPQQIGQGQYYVAGDSAHKDADGYFWILGRIDDVLNVSGHRLDTMEIEAALTGHPQVAEAAVVGKLDPIKGESVFAFVVCKSMTCPQGLAAHDLQYTLQEWVAKQIGAIAKPDEIRFVDNLPKTRSGKIMRRLLRSIARGEKIIQDISTLENPAILEQLYSNF